MSAMPARTRRRRRSFVPIGLFVLLLFLCAPVGPGDAQMSAAAEACPPSSPTVPASTPPATSPAGSGQPSPERIVACVGPQSITDASFEHWANIARKGEDPKRPPKAREVLKEVMGFLISSYWVIGEAAALNVHVSAGEVRRTFDRIRAQQFPKHGEFQTFLRQSGETVADLLWRVELNLLSERIQRHVLAGHRSARSQQSALRRFIYEFKRRWQAQTYCTPEYAVTDCGHVQAAL